MATPTWLDEVPNVDFTHEKRLLEDLVEWGRGLGWNPVETKGIDFSAGPKRTSPWEKEIDGFG
jgi:hypothetical protein